MPRIAYHHTPERRGPREQDFGYLFAIVRDAGLFVIRSQRHGGLCIIRERGAELFSGTVAECCRFMRERTGEVA